MDPKYKFFLFKQSQNFCSVPWNYFKIATDGHVTTCVKGTEVLGNINRDSLESILRNTKLIEIKKQLFQDQLPPNCAKCRSLDQKLDSSYNYLRDMYNDWFKKADIDYGDPYAFQLSGIDFHWSNTCNLKCVTCWPYQSSSIAQELGIPIKRNDTVAINSVIDYVIANQSNLKELYFSGGEPTLIKYNVRLLERLEPRSDLLLRVNTNMMFDLENKFIMELERFPNVLITISSDSIGDRFEYLRYGASWQTFINNMNYFQTRPYHLRINSVFFVASAWTMLETRRWFKENFQIDDFTINQCSMEKYDLLCRNLPDKIKTKVLNDLYNILDTDKDINTQGQISNCIDEINQPPNGLNYRDYFDEIDRRRGLDWRNIFPELI